MPVGSWLSSGRASPDKPPFRLFSADLDGTILGDPASTSQFTAGWNRLSPAQRPLLVYNTGRTVANTLALVAARALPEPDFIIGSVGTELHDPRGDHAAEFSARFRKGWDVAAVDQIVAGFSAARRQPAAFQHEFKSSWHWPRARHRDLETLNQLLAAAQLQTAVVYSCDHFLDVVPQAADKGNALAWLCRSRGIPLRSVIVAGDTANDRSMFLLPDVSGIVVANALPELIAHAATGRTFFASLEMAGGVMEGLRHFGVLPRATAT